MRIVIVVPDCGEGGLFQFYNSVVPVLAAIVDVHLVFASPAHSPLEPQIAGATCHKLLPESAAPILAQLLEGPLAVAPNVARALAVAVNAWQFARALDPDCVELSDWPLSAVAGVIDGAVPVIVQAHGSMGQIAVHDPARGGAVEAMLLQLIETQLFGLARNLQTYSNTNAQFWEQATNRPVAMIRPAFALPDQPVAAAGPNDRMSIFGRLQSWKGPDVLCAALERLGDKAPTCDWYGSSKAWPGTALSAESYLAQTFPAAWNRSLRFRGAIDRDQVAGTMVRSRAVIVPSTWDVFNFTMVEAMAAGRPVIVSSGAGASELIEHGVNGLVFPAGDAAALAAAIAAVAALSEAELQTIGTAARATIRRELDPARIVAERMAAYEQAIAAHRAAPPPPVPAWLSTLLTPGQLTNFDMQEFLGTLPLRPMLGAAADRIGAKVIPGRRPR